MILIADSGSTKTEWALTDLTSPPTILHTQGINPFMLTTEEIIRLLHSELMPQIFSPEIIATIISTVRAAVRSNAKASKQLWSIIFRSLK